MVDFFKLSRQDKILLALAVLKDYREPEEVTNWLNEISSRLAATRKDEKIDDTPRVVGTIKNEMRNMAKQNYDKQKEHVLKPGRKGKKILYKSGTYTVNSRLGALIILLLWKAYQGNNQSLTVEQATRVAENDEKLITEVTKGNSQLAEEAKWLAKEIVKEKPANLDVLDLKLSYIFNAGYFCKESGTKKLVKPTDRLIIHEKEYIEALIYLLPELQAIQNISSLDEPTPSKQSKHGANKL